MENQEEEGKWWQDEVSLPDVSAISIILDGTSPRVDLGDVSPYTAIVIFEQLAEMLRAVVQEPEITIDGVDFMDMIFPD